MPRSLPDYSLTDWTVLALVAEGPTHGWAVAADLAADGAIGRVWTVRRPLVYRSLATLEERGLVEPCGEEPSKRGPARTLLRATAAGRRALNRWLAEPVHHVRDVRTEFLVKLALLDRAGLPTAELVRRQNEALAPVFAALDRRAAPPSGFDDTLARWRKESARAAQRFLKSLATTSPSTPRKR